MTSEELWNELRDLFDTDDGSLPEIWLCNLSPNGVADIFTFLVQSSAKLEGATFWHIEAQKEVPVSAVPNAASCVVQGRAEPFHVLCVGLRSGGVLIPDLGVFVFDDHMALDYRMGDDWNGARLEALFSLLLSIRNIDPGAQIQLPNDVLTSVQARFGNALSRFAEFNDA